MSEQPPRVSVRFCPGCGETASPEANFCTVCGAALRAHAAAAKPQEAPSESSAASSRRAGLVIFASFLAVGLGLWFVVLQPASTARLPLAKTEASEPAPVGGQGLPASHPPIEIPREVQTYLADLEKKADAAPKDLDAWKTLAQIQYRAGQIDRQYLSKAERSWQHVLGIDAKNLDAIRGLGNVHFDREEYAKAVESYSRYLELKPDDANVRTDLGTMYLYSGADDRAIEEYRKVLAADAKFYQALFNLGIAYAKKGDPAKAVESFTQAKALAPDDPTRKQIQAMIDRANGTPPGAASATDAEAPATFQAAVERSVRAHPIVGPKVGGFEWSSPTSGKVLLDDFPMESMPEFVRRKFLDRLKGELDQAKKATGTSGTAKLDLVDRASGRVMATIGAE